ncbi:MAG: FtsQ-type POTRA domain-containing protein [Chloroflexi bacterium]|nr:MAG: FtsQ-type POTRA domain-containing protein [Chloroflexota bacterium]
MSEKKELSRADLVRLRRERENSQRRERAKKDATRPTPTVPKRAKQAVPKPKRKPVRSADEALSPRSARSARRRRFQIALLPVAPDATLRGISLPRPRLGPRLFSFFLVALFGAALYFAFNLPQFRVGAAQVTGNQMLSPEEINSSLNVTGESVFLLIPSKLETRLRLSFPELVAVDVNVTLPNIVSVHVFERKPVIRWEQAGGFTWISRDGVAFRPRGEVAGLISVVALSAPPTEGNVSPDALTPAPFISSDMVRAIQGLAGHVPPGMTILYDAGFGFGWNDPRGWRVYFGTKASDVELKVRVYESMVNSLSQRGIRPALINVTYPTAPYYRMSE